jgi:hypothetical protein
LSLFEDKIIINIAIKKNYAAHKKLQQYKSNLIGCFVDNIKNLEVGNTQNIKKIIHFY